MTVSIVDFRFVLHFFNFHYNSESKWQLFAGQQSNLLATKVNAWMFWEEYHDFTWRKTATSIQLGKTHFSVVTGAC